MSPLMSLRTGFKHGCKCNYVPPVSLSKFLEHLPRRRYSKESLKEAYSQTKLKFKSKKLPKDVNPRGVFACNELDLSEVQVYGFDYDYTLAHYKPSMEQLLYNLARQILTEKFHYPAEIAKLEYQPNFAVRGLHYDIDKGLLLKLDSFLQMQLGSVYRGLTPVSTKEVFELYKNRVIPIGYVEGDRRKSASTSSKAKMVHLADLFSVPEMGLICNIADFFIKNNIDYHPAILYLDVKNAVRSGHPIMHKIVANNVSEYIRPNKYLKVYFDLLKNNKKKLFLVTNSPYHFVNAGMEMLISKNWRDYFDVVIVNANKPSFFAEVTRPIRVFDKNANTHVWDKVTTLQKGIIYYEGTVRQLQELTGWYGHKVLYFGDHPYSDLADVTLQHGWRTGAIINELTHEIATLNTQTFKENANWLQMLTVLIEENQDYKDPESLEVMAEWMKERDQLRNDLKTVFNPQFGSVFRTYNNPTYFSRRLFRFADVYTSDITNLVHHSLTHTFYPRRGVMPHEYGSYFV
ncbi:unnamed protein product [Chrysodeixis includens]|uniref:5'-nucleotidase domain-containing protein 3 n=1 Tax=Chrysodeixis includens TaxID=689277 RepID=A0A9P0BVX8_CHRIL|nr:unnamed protein product [Chrysodeixis includens]